MLALLCAARLSAMDHDRFLEMNKKGAQQAKQQDWAGLKQTLLAIGKELQSPTPAYLLRMASVEMHLGNTAEAIRWMHKYADMGLKFNVAQDEDLKPLAGTAAYAAIDQTMKQRTQPFDALEVTCALPIPDLMPEDLTFDRVSGKFVVSSILHHSLFRVSLPEGPAVDCGLQELPLDDQAKRWPVLAVSFDPARKLLWMTASAMPGFSGYPHEDEGKAALLAIDPLSGKTVRRFDLSSGQPAVMGDMSVGPDGAVYVSDSIGGGVYRVQGDLKTAQLEKIAGDFFSPQTPVLAADGKRLFVADYSVGIAVVDLSRTNPPGQLNYLHHPETVATTGLDGMFLSGDSLIGIQNGTDPVRITRFRLNASQTEILSGEVVEQTLQRLGEPTHVIQVDGWFYVSANVGWDKIDDHGVLKPGERFTAPFLLRFRDRSRGVKSPNHKTSPRPPGRV